LSRTFAHLFIPFCYKRLDKRIKDAIILNMTTKNTLTTRQESFLEHLLACDGDAKRAAELAGYSDNSHYAVVKALRSEILDLAEGVLALNAPKAAVKMINIMDSDEPIPQANIKLQAAQTILDRVGVSKSERLDVKVEAPNGIFILPAKKETIIEAEYE
jgi:hypothetical protein